MTLSLAMYNSRGIVHAADRCISTAVEKENNHTESFAQSNSEQKIFLLRNQYGLSYSGTSSFSINNPCSPEGLKQKVALNTLLMEFLDQLNDENLTPFLFFKKILEYFNAFNQPGDLTIFIMTGYNQGIPFVLSGNTANLEIVNAIKNKFDFGLSYIGASDTLNPLLNTDGFAYDYAAYPIPDMVDFSAFLIGTVSILQHYQQRQVTVSKECDILIITPNSSYWASEPVLLQMQNHLL